MPDTIYQSSTTAPVNIAVVKYWGKRDPKLNLPTNSSISVTLSQADLRTHTTAACSSKFTEDTLEINSKLQDVSGVRTQACFRELRSLRSALESADSSLLKLSTLPLRIVSENNFPTAAGLASSAAGFAALVRAIANLYELPASPTELSRIARQGSGSACRSLFGGYVAWQMGEKDDGSDSVAVEVAPASHWPTMRALVLVASAAQKDVSSTSGMQTTVATSGLFPHRAKVVVPAAMAKMERAILEKDFATFADVTMRESNSFHSVCSDTQPPIFYLNSTSHAAIRVVEGINKVAGKAIAAYTFDAGPNAVIYFEEENKDSVAGTVQALLGGLDGWKGKTFETQDTTKLDQKAVGVLKEGVTRVILASVGEGPIKTDESLILATGEPVNK
ncbi:GHMP kinase [Calycina marina]|uniref:Diphosphomevalonate decarboxylase n=1 Tax=Calycina marina TaxID=1763456 RepID=A0A9P7Z6K3_9HELO|nr:GHMP kinase [Calycina marina]